MWCILRLLKPHFNMNPKAIFTYIVLAFVLSWLVWLPLCLHPNDTKLFFLHPLGALGPLVASVCTTFLFYKKEKTRALLASLLKFTPLILWVGVLLVPFLMGLVALGADNLLYGYPFEVTQIFTSKEFPNWSFVTWFMYNLIFIGYGEETGWRGFLLPEFQKKYSPIVATIFVTFIWAVWHVPLFFFRDGLMHMDVGGIIGWLMSLFTGSVIFTWLYNNSSKAIGLCALFHATVDVVFMANYQSSHINSYMGVSITLLGIICFILLLRNKQKVS